jgi:hypothetical protein
MQFLTMFGEEDTQRRFLPTALQKFDPSKVRVGSCAKYSEKTTLANSHDIHGTGNGQVKIKRKRKLTCSCHFEPWTPVSN